MVERVAALLFDEGDQCRDARIPLHDDERITPVHHGDASDDDRDDRNRGGNREPPIATI